MTISKKKFKELGWKYQGEGKSSLEKYQLKHNVKLVYNPEASEAIIKIVKMNGKEIEVARLEELTGDMLSEATEVLELNYVELIIQLFKNEY